MKNRILGTTAFALVAASPFAAFAQTAAPADAGVSNVDEVVVTGSYRRSLEQAVDRPRPWQDR